MATKLYNFCEASDLKIINSTFPTHFTNTSATLLDVFLTNDTDRVLLYDQISFPPFSTHDLILLSYDVNVTSCGPTQYSYYDYNSVRTSDLLIDAADVNWEYVYSESTVDLQIEFVQSKINDLFLKHVPIKTVLLKDINCSWLNNHIKHLIILRNSAYKRWKRFRVKEFWDKYKSLRNMVVKEIRKSKCKFYRSKFNCNLTSSHLWRNLRKLGVCNSKTAVVDIDPNVLNCNFLDYSSNSDSIRECNDSFLLTGCNNSSSFTFRSVTVADVCKAVYSIKSSAAGVGNIQPKFLKMLGPIIFPVIATVFNNAISNAVFPSCWKYAIVTPVPKCANPSAICDYRPISILPFLSKVFERLLESQIREYLVYNDLLCRLQSGFRPQHSCTTALLKISEDLRTAISNDNVVFLVLLDFTKAFDSVRHDLLVMKLFNSFGFSLEACRLIKSYLNHRFQQVKCGVSFSDCLPIRVGVPQGSILGPLLFSLFINDLPSVINFSNYHLYADDLQIYISSSLNSIDDTILKLNNDMDKIFNWSQINKLTLNAKKSKTLCIYRNFLDTNGFPQIVLGGSVIDYVDTAKNLGIIFNRRLSWSSHANSVTSKVYATLRRLSLTTSYLPCIVFVCILQE